jgi:hypothetical protein
MSDAVGPGPFVVPATVFWFMAVESYISTIYKTCIVIDDMLRAAGRGPLTGPSLRKTNRVVEKMGAAKDWIAPGCPPDHRAAGCKSSPRFVTPCSMISRHTRPRLNMPIPASRLTPRNAIRLTY